MRSATIIAATLASMAAAMPTAKATGSAIANIVAVNGFGDSATKTFVKVPFGTLTHVDLEITELDLETITLDVPDIDDSIALPNVNAITCQMYNDQYGVTQGSAQFTASQTAHISTNPVQFGWVLCYFNLPKVSS